MKRDELLAEVFAGEAQTLAERCGAWMVASPRFAAFVEANRAKIRKKFRTAADAEGRDDLLRELEVAYRLLGHRQAVVTYEAYAADKARGPDFSVTLKGHVRCNVEVKRLRVGGRPLNARLTDAVCEKLRQMPPSLPNLLWVVVEEPGVEILPQIGMAAVMKAIVQRAERKDETLFSRHGYADARAFFAHYLRLSGVLAYRPDAADRELWVNPQARHPFPLELIRWPVGVGASAPSTR